MNEDTAILYHAGCPVCEAAISTMGQLINPEIQLDMVDLRTNPDGLAEAKKAGVKSVPALVYLGQVTHLNFGADIEKL